MTQNQKRRINVLLPFTRTLFCFLSDHGGSSLISIGRGSRSPSPEWEARLAAFWMLALERSSCCCSCWFGEHPTILVGVCQNAQVTKNRERRPLTIEFFITNWHVADHYRFGESLGPVEKSYVTGFWSFDNVGVHVVSATYHTIDHLSYSILDF